MTPSTPAARHLLLPDFCAPRAVLMVLLIVTLTALLLALASADFGADFWISLARTLLFLVWIGLAGSAALCTARRHIAARSAAQGSLLVLGIVTVLVALVSEAAFRILSSPALNPASLLGEAPFSHWSFLARNIAISLIVTTLALRYFYVAQQWRLNVEAQARARADALQARIRPHFLYNSMNTIAALTRSDPARAEGIVLDLADLFRVSLREQRSLITLGEELEAARSYQRIEQQRLGERLRVRWDVANLPQEALIPALTLQPLLENAIGHGIENLSTGGEVTISGRADDGMLLLTVRNPLPQEAATSQPGHGIALDNIRERLALLFGARAAVTAGREGGEFMVQLRLPLTTVAPGATP